MSSSNKIAIIQFPGSNTERETFMACDRAGLEPVDFLWNQPLETLSNFDGYIIVGGFSYEDRSRAGAIAALDPIMKQIKIEANLGKPVLGICNGAQILVESGLVPGIENNRVSLALTNNKRVKKGHVIGVGYYNAWSNLKVSVPPERCAFTRKLKLEENINIPLAHGEGRFVLSEQLLEKIVENNQAVYLYCDERGRVVDEFPINPNGSTYNLAAVCNPAGNVMAMMPHPERTTNGDPIFSSMKDFIENNNPTTSHTLDHDSTSYEIAPYRGVKNVEQWVVDMVITDNDAISVQSALVSLGYDISLTRQTHWEIETSNYLGSVMKKIEASGELYNSNKEFISNVLTKKNTKSFLVRQKEDVLGKLKLQTLKEKFEINEISNIKRGVIWNLTVNGGNFESVIAQILETHILYNPLTYECYEIS
ncbi:MAG: phosphoribosylformylglycinamidine synthase I [Fidelibacterota bacterium]|jgi:phosphoribosylformylglycinamidine synthase I|tara:strand:+ start:4953 stop:6218 length:1266 start_codon:yes stop_codon:yes gene_type:complete